MNTPQNPIIWTPSTGDLTQSLLARFRDSVNRKHGLALMTYDELHRWSVKPSTAGDFWMDLFDFLDIGAFELPTAAFASVSIHKPDGLVY